MSLVYIMKYRYPCEVIPYQTSNRLDLDSYGDGCFDVLEAGMTDADGNGQLRHRVQVIMAQWLAGQ